MNNGVSSCIESMPHTNSETSDNTDEADVPSVHDATFSSAWHGLCILFKKVIFLAYPCVLFSDAAEPTDTPRDFSMTNSMRQNTCKS